MEEKYVMNNEGEYGKYIVQTLQAPAMSEDFKEFYKTYANRLLWMDANVVPGAFQMNTAWYAKVPERDPIFMEHVHDDADELIGFIGSDPDNPGDLGGEIEFTIDGEAHLLTKSSIIFAPAGIVHNPMRILRVDRPIFHFSVVTTHLYDGSGTYK